MACGHPPIPKKGGQNWITRIPGGHIPDEIECVARALYWTPGAASGDEQRAYEMAVGIAHNFAEGKQKISKAKQGKYVAAIAKWEALRAASHARSAAKNLSAGDRDCGCAKSLDLASHDTTSRKRLASKGQALPGGRFPIADEADLRKAIRAVGRAKGSHNAVRKFVIRRARALGKSQLIPDSWKADGSVSMAAPVTASLISSGTITAAKIRRDAVRTLDLAGPVVTSKAGQPVTVNALMQGMEPRHVKALAKANRNLQRSGMPVAKRRKVLRSMAKGLKSGRVSLSHPVDLAFNPSEMRAPKGAAGGGRWTAGGASRQQPKGKQNPQTKAALAAYRKAYGPVGQQGPPARRRREKLAAYQRRVAKWRAREAAKRAREKQAQHNALQAVNAARGKYKGLGTNRHMQALAFRSKLAGNSQARVQAARALAKIIRQHGSARTKARRQAATAQRGQARQAAASVRARAAAAARASRQQAASARASAATTARAQRQQAAAAKRAQAQRARSARAMTRPAKIQTGAPKRTAIPRKLVSRL